MYGYNMGHTIFTSYYCMDSKRLNSVYLVPDKVISLLRHIRDKSSRNELSAATVASKYVQDHDSCHSRLRGKR